MFNFISQFRKENENIKKCFTFTLISSCTRAIWDSSIFSSYVYLLTGNNTSVGYLSGISGLILVLMAPLMGSLADKFERNIVLKFSGIVGIFAIFVTCLAIIKGHYTSLFYAMMLWGIFWASVKPTIDSLIADSSDIGERSRLYSIQFSLSQSASSLGPIISLILFYYLGDKWTILDCKEVILLGLISFSFSIPILFSFVSNSTTNIVNNNIKYDELPIDDSTNIDDDKEFDLNLVVNKDAELLLSISSSIKVKDGNIVVKEANNSNLEIDNQLYISIPFLKGVLYIPAMIAFSDVITGLASGCSVKFFPIFFMEILNLSPVTVMQLYIITPLLISYIMIYTQKLSKILGRIWATALVKTTGIILLVSLCFLAKSKASLYIILPVYVIRTAVMNSTKPLTKSIIMDIVPKEQRAKWNSLELINGAGWSGSAVIGGLLIDKYGLLNNFLFTALLQFLALIPIMLISHLVPHETETIKEINDDVSNIELKEIIIVNNTDR